jgi:hypothetical protein
VDDSCVLDFGTRTLVIEGSLRLPNSGELSLTAGTIQLAGRIQNIAGQRAAAPAAIRHAGVRRRSDLDGPIRIAGVRSAPSPGELTIQAGGNLTVRSR